jgi:hypothetical protein
VAKPSPKVLIVSGDTRKPALNIDSTKWRQIEEAYGLSLPPNVRTDIDRATQAFLFFESFERTAEPLAKVKVILEAHEKAATRFFNELFASPFAGSDAGVYAHHLIEKNLKISQVPSDTARLDTLLNLLRAFHIACNTSIKQLNEPSSSSTFRKGNAWTNWISRLTEILSGAKLAAAVRKDIGSKSRSDQQSPFTLLVWELQLCLPIECRRHTHSVAALADAISEERKISGQISPARGSPARTRQQAGKKGKR